MSSSEIVLGCLVAVVSSAIQSLGITLQRKSHIIPNHRVTDRVLDRVPDHHQKHKRNMWVLGFSLFIVANIFGSIVQITTLPLIILSPLQSIGLIFNSLLSCALLGESFTFKLGFGTFLISIGAFIIAFNGGQSPPSPPDTDPIERFNEILHKLIRPSFLLWFICTFIIIGLTLAFNFTLTYKIKMLQQKSRRSRSIVKWIEKLKFTKGIGFGVISGTLTAHTFLFAKSLIDVVVETIMSERHDVGKISTNITPYMLLIVMLAIVGCQLTAFNLGLAQISTSILYPLCFLVYNMFNLINDLTFNSLISQHVMSIRQLMWVIIGLIAVLIGVVTLSWDSAFGNQKSHYRDEDDYILQSKFPYTESLGLLDLDVNDYSTISNPKKKRVLSYEQEQLLRAIS